MSGYVAGIEMAVPDLKAAEILWKARDIVASYLSSHAGARSELLTQLDGLDWQSAVGSADIRRRLELLATAHPAHAAAAK